VIINHWRAKTVSTVFPIAGESSRGDDRKTVKTVFVGGRCPITPLKRGVNESIPLSVFIRG
jgi:hypothetical protein